MANISGTSANETLTGDTDGPGTNDTFLLQTGGSGDNNGLDQYYGGGGYNRILGGWSYDVLRVLNNLSNLHDIQEIDGGDGQPGYNTILATDGNDTLDFSSYVVKAFTIDGGKGNDTVTGTSGANNIRGGEGNDTLNGGAGNDTFHLITGGNTNGTDQYDGGADYDRIVGGWSYDTLNVKNGLTNLVGIEELDGGDTQFGYNTILGTADHDILNFSGMSVKYFVIDGQGGNDTITGTADVNQIRGGAGNDTMDGGEADDTYLVGAGHGADRFLDSGTTGGDRITATAANVSIGIAALAGIELITSGGYGNVNVIGTADHQTLDFSNTAFSGIGLVDALGGNDVISTSNLTAQTYRGGAGNDTFNLGAASTVLRVSSADNGGYDTFSGNTAGATHRILAETAGTQIGISTNYANGVDVIDGNGKANVTVNGSSGSHDNWDLSSTELIDIAEVATAGGNDQIHTSDDSNAAGGQAYRGGAGNDSFFFGTQGTRLFVSSADNGGFDSFSGNGTPTHTIVVDDANTRVGITTTYGGSDSVDIIDGNGKGNVSIVGSDGSHDKWDLSATRLIGITAVSTGGGNDQVQTALMEAGDTAITYDGGAGGSDKLTISLTAAQAGNATLMAQIAALNSASAVNGTLNAGGVHLTALNWESFAVAVDVGGSFQPLNILFGTANHDSGPPYTPVLSVPAAKVNESWAIFGLGGDDKIVGGNKADFIDGGGGNDNLNGGDGDDSFFVAASTPANGYDVFNGDGGSDRILSGDGSDIRVNGISSIEEISGGGFSGVDLVTNPSAHVALDLSGTELRGIDLVYTSGGTANNVIHTSSDSDAAGGQAYRGGAGNDTFVFGSQDTRLLAFAADNAGFDAYQGNGVATHTIIAQDDGTRIGLAGSYGGTNSVDAIDGNGHANVTIVGSNAVHNAWDFSDTDLIDIAEIRGGDNTASDTIVGSSAGDHIFGLGANDNLNGGLGNDTLTGGLGADSFTFTSTGAANVDHVADYAIAQNDRIVLTSLLSFPVSGGAVGDYVRVVHGATDTEVQIDSDGAGGDWTLVATLDDYLGSVRVQAGTASQVYDLA